MNKHIVASLLIAAWSLAVFGCGRQEASQNPVNYPASLIVVDGARSVVYGENRGAVQVRYVLEAPYPAKKVVAALLDRLARQNWSPLKADFMNPAVATAHVTGWTVQTNREVRPPMKEYSWNGEWRNPAGDILVYALFYRYPENGPPALSRLSVAGAYIPREAAAKAMRHVEKF